MIPANTAQSTSTPEDAIQVHGRVRPQLEAVSVTRMWYCKRKQAMTTSVPTHAAFAGPHTLRLVQT